MSSGPDPGDSTPGDEPSALVRALRHHGFRRFFAARTISQWGDTFNSVALVILAYRLTGSGLKVGATVVFEIVPVLLFGFVAGALVDQMPRRAIMVMADLGRASIAGALALSHTNLMVVYAAAFGLSALTVLFNPASSSVLPALVGPDDLVGANSAVWSAAVISQIVLAPAAGGLVALAGAGPAFGINAASFAVSAVLLAGLAVPAPALDGSNRYARDIAEGFRYIRRSRFLATLVAVQGLAALSAGATSALLVVLAERHMHVGAGRFGLLLGAIGVGAGIGPLVLQRVARDVRRAAWLFGPYLLRGAVDLTLAASSSFAVATGALALYGVGTSTGNVTYNSVLQSTVPDRLRGRVFASYDVVWQAARLLSIGAGGLLADRVGITAVYLLGAGLLALAGVLGLARAGIPTGPSIE
ncbi:MAG: MFS transporter [Acidimicrobiales bacterium]